MLLLFVIVSVISFAGSIHPGPVNLAVAQATLSHNRSAGLWLAFGGSLPEIAYSALAAGGLMLLPIESSWLVILMYAPIPVLLGAGLAAFRQKPVTLNTVPVGGALFQFWKGIVLGGTNPQLVFFWSAVWLYLNTVTLGDHRLIPNAGSTGKWVFALGTAAGAFALLVVVVWLVDRQRERVLNHLNGPWLNRLTGGLFVGMALWQTIRVMTA